MSVYFASLLNLSMLVFQSTSLLFLGNLRKSPLHNSCLEISFPATETYLYCIRAFPPFYLTLNDCSKDFNSPGLITKSVLNSDSAFLFYWGAQLTHVSFYCQVRLLWTEASALAVIRNTVSRVIWGEPHLVIAHRRYFQYCHLPVGTNTQVCFQMAIENHAPKQTHLLPGGILLSWHSAINIWA